MIVLKEFFEKVDFEKKSADNMKISPGGKELTVPDFIGPDLQALTHCPLGNVACFLVICCFFFSKSTISKNSFSNIINVSNNLDPDQARHYVGPDLVPNCLQRLSADDTFKVIQPQFIASQKNRK